MPLPRPGLGTRIALLFSVTSPNGDPGATDAPSFAELTKDLLVHAQKLVRDELALAKAELREDVTNAIRSSAVIVAGAVLGFYALGFALVTITYGIAAGLPWWAAALIVTTTLLAASGALVMSGVRRLQRLDSPGYKTRTSMRETVAWAKQQMT